VSTTDPVPEELAPLQGWLETHLAEAEAVELLGVKKASSGFSADTTMVDVAVTRAGIANEERYVLRTESPDPPVYPVQVPGWQIEIELQYRIMDALGAHSDVPVAPMIGYEADPSVLGTQFFVMGFLEGQVPVEDPPYTTAGFFLDLTPAERTEMIERGLATVARVHAVDWRAAGLDFLVPSGAAPSLDRQLDVWEDYYRTALGDRVHPLADRAFAWLRAEWPRCSEVGLCWGDPRPGNIIWRDAAPICTTDYEAASIAPPELDVGWWLMFDRTMHEWAGVERAPGDPTRAEQLRMYEAASGRSVPDVQWFEICAAARYCAIVVRVMNRAVDRGLMPEDHTIWLENPASAALDSLLTEL
jgi:aminoglycoside phosphotransferase (APT) family kinase protein